MRNLRILPPVYASSSCPLSSLTLNCVFGRASTTVPSISIASFFGNARSVACGALLLACFQALSDSYRVARVDWRRAESRSSPSNTRVYRPVAGTGRVPHRCNSRKSSRTFRGVAPLSSRSRHSSLDRTNSIARLCAPRGTTGTGRVDCQIHGLSKTLAHHS